MNTGQDAVTASLIKAGVEIEGAVLPDRERPLYFSLLEQPAASQPATGTQPERDKTNPQTIIAFLAGAGVVAVAFFAYKAVSK